MLKQDTENEITYLIANTQRNETLTKSPPMTGPTLYPTA
jgi:hypothetical protein